MNLQDAHYRVTRHGDASSIGDLESVVKHTPASSRPSQNSKLHEFVGIKNQSEHIQTLIAAALRQYQSLVAQEDEQKRLEEGESPLGDAK